MNLFGSATLISTLLGIPHLSVASTYTIATDCDNWIYEAFEDSFSWSELFPVGTCYYETYSGSGVPSYGYLCESDGNDTMKAVEYAFGDGCDMSVRNKTGIEYPCNYPDQNDTCSCQLGT